MLCVFLLTLSTVVDILQSLFPEKVQYVYVFIGVVGNRMHSVRATLDASIDFRGRTMTRGQQELNICGVLMWVLRWRIRSDPTLPYSWARTIFCAQVWCIYPIRNQARWITHRIDLSATGSHQ